MPRKKDVAVGQAGISFFHGHGLLFPEVLLCGFWWFKDSLKGRNVRHKIMKVAKDCERFPEAMADIATAAAAVVVPARLHNGSLKSGVKRLRRA